GSGAADHRGIAADGERGFTRLGAPPATEEGRGEQGQAGGESQEKKKLYWYTRLGKIEIEEQIFTQGRQGPQIRAFCECAGVECRGYSEGLQRAMTDFGADEAFAGAATKLKEHYGIEVPVSAVRGFTEAHGEAMQVQEKLQSDWQDRAGVPVLITEMDGSMLPVVETAEPGVGEAPIDRRKTRQVGWKEARLALAHTPGSVAPIFGASLGTVEEAGERLAVCALQAGAGSQTKIHGVGDGAVWIIEQMAAQFGSQAQYLVDFYPLCDYLAAAGEVIAGNDKPAWMEEKKDWLKDNRWKDVLEALRPVIRTGQHPRFRGSGAYLLSLYLQSRKFPGLQRRPSRGLTHRFGRD